MEQTLTYSTSPMPLADHWAPSLPIDLGVSQDALRTLVQNTATSIQEKNIFFVLDGAPHKLSQVNGDVPLENRVQGSQINEMVC